MRYLRQFVSLLLGFWTAILSAASEDALRSLAMPAMSVTLIAERILSEGDVWKCGENSGVVFPDCSEVRNTMLSLGDGNGGWWTVDNTDCHSWKNGKCKATFCPQVQSKDGLRIFMPDLVWSQFVFIGFMCAAKGERGIVVPANATWALHITEPEWSESSVKADASFE